LGDKAIADREAYGAGLVDATRLSKGDH